MNSITPAPMPKLPAHATQAQIAKAYMTPETKSVLPDNVLNGRIGNGTVAGGLNDSIVIRVRGEGANRQFVADSKLAAELLATPAGDRLIQQLKVASSSSDWLPEKTHLMGFVLPADNQAVAAASVLSDLEPGGPPAASPKEPTPRTPATLKKFLQEEWRGTYDGSKSAGAWNERGWITFMPDTARGMLVAAGAYQPDRLHKTEKSLRLGGKWAPYVVMTPTHEVQHSITSRKGRYETERWFEEGIANIFSKTPIFARREAERTGINPHTYSAQLSHKPDLDLGWGPWARPKMNVDQRKETDKVQKQRYADSQPILRGLLRMAGAPLNTNAGVDKARQLLQSTELNRVPGNLANAIIERNGLDHDVVYEKLRQRIIHAVEDPKSLEKIAKEFGVSGP